MERVVVYSLSSCAAIEPVGTSCPAGQYCSMQGPVTFSLAQATQHLPAAAGEISPSVQDRFLRVLHPKCAVSLAIGTYHLVMMGIKEQRQ